MAVTYDKEIIPKKHKPDQYIVKFSNYQETPSKNNRREAIFNKRRQRHQRKPQAQNITAGNKGVYNKKYCMHRRKVLPVQSCKRTNKYDISHTLGLNEKKNQKKRCKVLNDLFNIDLDNEAVEYVIQQIQA